MKVSFKERLGTWRNVADAARTTINMEEGNGEPSSKWKKRMLRCEHSPTRQLRYSWKWSDLKYWVSVHIVRHKFGIEHFIGTQRDDRNENAVSRDDAPQGTFVTHQVEANAQSIINISRKRLCTGASPETRQAWQAALNEIRFVDPELYESCVPEYTEMDTVLSLSAAATIKLLTLKQVLRNTLKDLRTKLTRRH